MLFTKELQRKLLSLSNISLPGTITHNEIMDWQLRKHIFKKSNHSSKPLSAAVLVLLYPGENQQVYVLFIQRNFYQGHHSGQISFPGGKKEKFDANLQQTALRETFEEVGVFPEQVNIVKQLTPLYIPVSNFNVSPFLGFLTQTPVFKLDPYEVSKILELNLERILTAPLIHFEKEYFGKTYQLKSFKIDDIHIWGATAMILSETRKILQTVI